VEEQASFCEEMARIWESSKRMENILQDLVDQTKASLDAMELFMRGEFFPKDLGDGKTGGVRGGTECVEETL